MKVVQVYCPEEQVRLPREDAWAMDEKHLAFAVADAVHMFPGLEYKRGKNYPSPSPAGKLSQEFCKNFITFQKGTSVEKAFIKANRAVFHLNKNRDKFGTFLKAEAYYAATASTGRIKGRILEWSGICDSSITVIDAKGRIVLSHTDHVHHNKFNPLMRPYFHLDQSYIFRTIFRNAIAEDGEKLGYGVITGEKEAEPYIWKGKRTLKKDEIVIFATDGFEKYLQSELFRRAILSMGKERIEKIMMALKDVHHNDKEFVSERTLIAVRID